MVTERGSKRVDFMDPAQGREQVLRVVRAEADNFMALALGANEQQWLAPSACEGWAVRDCVGHMVDTTQTYLARYVMALEGYPTPEPLGMGDYSKAVDNGAQALRDVPQPELIGRLKGNFDHLYEIWTGLPPDQWGGLMINHKYAGPVPQFMMVMFQLLDYTFHSWDMQNGLAQQPRLSAEGAGILVPFIPMLLPWEFTSDQAKGQEFTIGLDVDGPYGGTWKAAVNDGQFTLEEGDISGSTAIIKYKDAEAFCLEHYGRAVTGTVDGDPRAVDRFRSLFNYL